MQTYLKSILDPFCLPKSYQLPYALNQEYETWGFLISGHQHPMTIKNASYQLPPSMGITNTEA